MVLLASLVLPNCALMQSQKTIPGWRPRAFQRWLPLIQKLSELTSAVSVPIQRCKLAENLWTALIQLRSTLKNQFFIAAKSALSNVVSSLISSETAPNSADFLWIQDDMPQINFQFYLETIRSSSNSLHRILIFSPYCWNGVNSKEVFVLPSKEPKMKLKHKLLGFLVLLKWENWYESTFQKHFRV